MPKEFSRTQYFPCPPERARGMLTDPQYMRRRAEATGALAFEAEVRELPDGGLAVSTSRTFPSRVPSYAAKLVGETLTVTEEQIWAAPGAAGPDARLAVSFSGLMTFEGTLTLRAKGEGTEATTAGRFRASIPLIGGKMESLAAEQTERYLAAEEEVASGWLAGGA